MKIGLYKFIMDLKKLKAEAEFNANLVTEINALRKKALSKFDHLFSLINTYDNLWNTKFKNSYRKLIQEFKTYMKKMNFSYLIKILKAKILCMLNPRQNTMT